MWTGTILQVPEEYIYGRVAKSAVDKGWQGGSYPEAHLTSADALNTLGNPFVDAGCIGRCSWAIITAHVIFVGSSFFSYLVNDIREQLTYILEIITYTIITTLKNSKSVASLSMLLISTYSNKNYMKVFTFQSINTTNQIKLFNYSKTFIDNHHVRAC